MFSNINWVFSDQKSKEEQNDQFWSKLKRDQNYHVLDELQDAVKVLGSKWSFKLFWSIDQDPCNKAH